MSTTIAVPPADERPMRRIGSMVGLALRDPFPSCTDSSVEILGSSGVNTEAFAYYAPLARVREHVDRNPDDSLSLSKAARIAGFSSKYFSSFFRVKVGVRFSQWYAHIRVLRAIKLMRSHNDSITNIAFAIGFHDLRTFERVFKRHTGVTPRQYKNVVRPS